MSLTCLTVERLKELLEYDPDTGLFTWRDTRNGYRLKGAMAGYRNPRGYVQLRVDKTLFKAHRLAWLYMTGEWPEGQIDHMNCIKDDNRWRNLRLASNRQNAMNRPSLPGRLKGASWHKGNGKWKAQINLRGRKVHLGYFATEAEAHAAYTAAAVDAYGEFARAA